MDITFNFSEVNNTMSATQRTHCSKCSALSQLPFASAALTLVSEGHVDVADLDVAVLEVGRAFLKDYDKLLTEAMEKAQRRKDRRACRRSVLLSSGRRTRPPLRYNPAHGWTPGSGAAVRHKYDYTDSDF